MQTIFKIFLVIVSLFVPALLIFLLVLNHFLLFGSGAGSEEQYEKYENIYIAIYTILGLLHIVLLLKMLKQDRLIIKIMVTAILLGSYVYSFVRL
ncbi:hypothetical protein ACLI1A_07100 [Flavobacterium sp. RHBU_3]|uniref:hypothetical protein n=1 Tax=Flavobacterium sp. RHBU_3 TaxID=3391184 RepID=UPI0039851403